MHDPENIFPPEHIDHYIEQPDNQLMREEAWLLHELQGLYDQEKQAAIERVWTRLAQHHLAANLPQEALSPQKSRREPTRSFPMQSEKREHLPRKRFARTFSLIMAAVVCALLVSSLALIFRLRQDTTNLGTRPFSTPVPTPEITATPPSSGEGKLIASWTSVQPGSLDIRALSWSPDSQRVAADTQESVEIRDATTGKNKLTIPQGGLSAAWSPNGRYIAVDGTIYSASSGVEIKNLLQSIAFTSPIGGSVLSARMPTSGGSGIMTVAWSPDSQFLAGALFGSANGGNRVVVWNVSTGKVVYTFLGQSEDVIESLAWSPDGKYIASASVDGVTKVWGALTGKVIFQHSNNMRVDGLAWSHAGMKLAFVSGNGTIQVWDVAAKKKITSLSTDGWARFAWSPDDSRIATSSKNSVTLWDATTGDALYTFTQQKGQVTALAWSPNGKYIASASITGFPANGMSTSTATPSIPTINVLVWLA